MKTSFFTFLFTAFLSLAYGQNNGNDPKSVRTVTTDTSTLGIIPLNIGGLHDIVLNPDNHTWKDLDNYYRNFVLANPDKHYFGNLKKMTIWHMVEQFGMLEKADLGTVEFYVLEQQSLDLIYPDVFMKCLLKMGEEWPDEKVKSVALAEYKRTMDFIMTSLMNPYEYLSKHEVKLNALKNFAETYPDGWKN